MATTDSRVLSRRVLEMEESATLRMTQLARDLNAKGINVINLSIGEPDFDTPTHIKEAAKRALDEGFTKYTPVPGIPELREAISRKFRRDNNLNYKASEIVVSNGAKQSVFNIAAALLDEGDEAILLAPYWVSYAEIIKMVGGVPVEVYAGVEQDYKATAEQIEAAITERTKFILFSSPCNPTGSVYTAEELEAIAHMLARHDQVFVVSDEIYEYINFTDRHVSIGTFPDVSDRTITINGYSKGFAMTGWRLGYMGAPAEIAAACNKIQGQVTSGANSFSQKAAAYALDADMAPTHEMCRAFEQRRDLVVAELSKIPGLKVNRPQGAFYSFPECSAYFGKRTEDGHVITNADELAEYLLLTGNVATVSGGAFGAPSCIRLSFAASEAELREAIRRIGEALGRLS